MLEASLFRFSYPGYADRVVVVWVSGRGMEGYSRFCGLGGDGDRVGLSIMADIGYNCMKRCDSREMCMASLSMCLGELAEACGGMSGVESLCTGSVLKSGV